MRLATGLLVSVAAALGACATSPKESRVATAITIWAPGADGCDFAEPQRENALAISTSYGPTPTGRAPNSARSHAYVVRNAQLQTRPAVGAVYCLSVKRHRPFGPTYALFGFELEGVDAGLALSPRFARIDSPAVRERTGSPVQVSIGFGAARLNGQRLLDPDSATFDLGPVQPGGQPLRLTGPARIFRWTENGATPDILRIAAVVIESRPEEARSVREAEIRRTLSEIEPRR